jgi:hypothetical protein
LLALHDDALAQWDVDGLPLDPLGAKHIEDSSRGIAQADQVLVRDRLTHKQRCLRLLGSKHHGCSLPNESCVGMWELTAAKVFGECRDQCFEAPGDPGAAVGVGVRQRHGTAFSLCHLLPLNRRSICRSGPRFRVNIPLHLRDIFRWPRWCVAIRLG